MGLVWLIFMISAILAAGATWHFFNRARGRQVVDGVKAPLPWQWDAMFLFVGAIGVVSTVPGLFFGQPHWAIDHVWWLISIVAKEPS